ncbi:MAG: hypothetical protein ACNYWM_05645 [Methanosarcinales archaeon]
MNYKLIGNLIMIFGFVMLGLCSFSLPQYEKITVVAIWVGAFFGGIISHGYYYARYNKLY